jgi:hypothetical protein
VSVFWLTLSFAAGRRAGNGWLLGSEIQAEVARRAAAAVEVLRRKYTDFVATNPQK